MYILSQTVPCSSEQGECEVSLLSCGLVNRIEKVGQEGRGGGRDGGRKEEFLCICSG